MKIVEVVEKQGKEKAYWNITIEGGPSKYANWFDLPAPTVGMTDFEMVQGREYVDKQGKQRHYWNARPSNGSAKIIELEKRIEAIEKFLSSGKILEVPSKPMPDDMQGDPMGDSEIPF